MMGGQRDLFVEIKTKIALVAFKSLTARQR